MAEIIFVSTRRPRNGAGLCVLHCTILSCNNHSKTPVDRPDYSETGPFMSHEAIGHQSLIKPASAWPANFKDLSSVIFGHGASRANVAFKYERRDSPGLNLRVRVKTRLRAPSTRVNGVEHVGSHLKETLSRLQCGVAH